MRIPSHLSMADKSAVCAINDSVGKFCKHVRTSPFSERRTEHYEKNLHMQRKRAAILAPPSCLMLLLFACRRCICSFTSSKGGVLSRSSTRQLVRTDFPNRVINRHLRGLPMLLGKLHHCAWRGSSLYGIFQRRNCDNRKQYPRWLNLGYACYYAGVGRERSSRCHHAHWPSTPPAGWLLARRRLGRVSRIGGLAGHRVEHRCEQADGIWAGDQI